MLKDLQVTLYDIFGYLLPGIVVLVALWVLAWALYFPHAPLGPLDLSGDERIFLTIAAYFLGHVVQAVGNMIARFLSAKAEEQVVSCEMPHVLVENARTRAGKSLGVNLTHLKAKWLVQVCDEAFAACGTAGEREVFQHREGFYRGLAIAFCLLSLAVLARLVVPGSTIEVGHATYPVPIAAWSFLCVLLALSTVLTWLRYRRFQRYRIVHAITGYLVMPERADVRHQAEVDEATVSVAGEGRD